MNPAIRKKLFRLLRAISVLKVSIATKAPYFTLRQKKTRGVP